jgi:GT2 family glycosyltransferase
MTPDVAVVVAAYNADKTIVAAIESVLSGPLECAVFVVDDASRVPVADCLRSLSARITILRLDVNVGPAAARNAALRLILDRGFKYVAIMDADDMSYPNRLTIQAAYLEQNPAVGAVGTWTRLFDDETGETIRINRRAVAPNAVRNLMFFNIGLSHASAMIRVDALRRVGIYSDRYPAAEDYELLRRIGTCFQLANIPECLLHYRISPGGQSLRRRRRQLYDRLRVQIRYFEWREWRAWVGAFQTVALFLVPMRILQIAKSMLGAK